MISLNETCYLSLCNLCFHGIQNLCFIPDISLSVIQLSNIPHARKRFVHHVVYCIAIKYMIDPIRPITWWTLFSNRHTLTMLHQSISLFDRVVKDIHCIIDSPGRSKKTVWFYQSLIDIHNILIHGKIERMCNIPMLASNLYHKLSL